MVVVTRLAPHVNHAVDAAATAQCFASGVEQGATVQARVGFGFVAPVGARIANAVQVTHGDVNPVVIIFAPRLDQQHALAGVCRQAIGQQATCCASADDDVVEGGGCHLAVGMTNSAPLAMLSGQRCMMLFCLV